MCGTSKKSQESPGLSAPFHKRTPHKADIAKLKGKMKEKVEANKELGLLSKKLATIYTDCEVTFNEDDYEMCMPDAEKVQEIFEELEFRRLKDQFLRLFYVSNNHLNF